GHQGGQRILSRRRCLLEPRHIRRPCREQGEEPERRDERRRGNGGARGQMVPHACPSASSVRCWRTAFCARRAAFSSRSVATCSRSGRGRGAGTVAHSLGAGGSIVSIMPRL